MNRHVPRVSIVMPAYYSHETIGDSLEALRTQTFQDFEVMVVNSSPEDHTRLIVTERFPEVVFDQSSTRLFPHAARNRGVGSTRGDLIVFTDPDCRARPDWLAKLVQAHDSGRVVVGGSMELATGRWFEQGVHLCKFSWLLSGLSPGPRWILPTANVCYSRKVWNAIGPLDEDLFIGDALICWRAHALGYVPWFEPSAVVEHRHGENLMSLWHQRFERGREFAKARADYESWSRLRAAIYVVLLPALVLLVIMRAGINSFSSGWGLRFVLTLPVQFVGQLGWCLGEAHAQYKLAAYSSK